MSEEQIATLVAQYAQRYPDPHLNSDQAAEIAGVRTRTLHNWSSQGALDGLRAPGPGRLWIYRDAFVRAAVTGALRRAVARRPAGDANHSDGGVPRPRRRPAARPPTTLEDLP